LTTSLLRPISLPWHFHPKKVAHLEPAADAVLDDLFEEYETWTARFGGQPNVGLLRKTLEPIEAADGRDRTLTRWRSLIAGLNPRFFPNGDPFAANLRKFANAPAAYDDPDWAMSDADRRDLAKLTDGLGLSP